MREHGLVYMYRDLFELKAQLQNDKANLVLNLFKKKLAELEN